MHVKWWTRFSIYLRTWSKPINRCCWMVRAPRWLCTFNLLVHSPDWLLCLFMFTRVVIRRVNQSLLKEFIEIFRDFNEIKNHFWFQQFREIKIRALLWRNCKNCIFLNPNRATHISHFTHEAFYMLQHSWSNKIHSNPKMA